jgi:AcrR family transcriptional regulator
MQILEAAAGALEGADFGALTVEAVTRRAGMTRSAFYHYYSGLDELVLALLENYEDEIKAAVNPLLEHPEAFDDPRAAMISHLSDMFAVFEAHRTSVRAVTQAASGSRRVFAQWQARAVDYFIDLTARFIEQEVARGRAKVSDPLRTARALILMNNAVGMDNILREEPDDPAEIGRVIGGIWNDTIYGRGGDPQS